MPIKLKSIVAEIKKEQPIKNKQESKGKALLREFLSKVSKAPYKDDDVWEDLRKTIAPRKYANVEEMFKRWSELVKYGKN